MVRTAKEFDADFVFIGALTLFGNKPADCKTLYYSFLDRYYPDLVSRYQSLYRDLSQPAKEYQMDLERKTGRLCHKYGVKNRII